MLTANIPWFSKILFCKKEEEALKSKESQIDDIYRKAIQSGDADLISKADTLKNDIAIQKEKLRVAKSRQAQSMGAAGCAATRELPSLSGVKNKRLSRK